MGRTFSMHETFALDIQRTSTDSESGRCINVRKMLLTAGILHAGDGISRCSRESMTASSLDRYSGRCMCLGVLCSTIEQFRVCCSLLLIKATDRESFTSFAADKSLEPRHGARLLSI